MTGKGKVGFFSGFHPVDAILAEVRMAAIEFNAVALADCASLPSGGSQSTIPTPYSFTAPR